MDSHHGNTFGLLLLAFLNMIFLTLVRVVALLIQQQSHHNIGDNYFCETGYNVNSNTISANLYPDDPLWDGEECGLGHSCECTLHFPPWFTAQLNTSTTDDIEVRSCSNDATRLSNVGIELIELYVK